MPALFLKDLASGYEATIREAFTYLGLDRTIKRGDRVSIKPNLTFPEFRPGVMTNPEMVEALIRVLKDLTPTIRICEADSGGYNRFSMNEVFEKTGLSGIAKKYGVEIVNLSLISSVALDVHARGRVLHVPVTRLLTEETDLFITVPVPKIHMNTGVSMSVKNQWGTIQLPSERLKLHPYFKEVIYEVNTALPRSISVIDGKYGLNRSGPMKGDVVDLGWLMVADDLFAADFLCCLLMGIDPLSVSYLAYAFHRQGITGIESFQLNTDYRKYIAPERFYLRRSWTDYPGLLTFKSRFLAYIGYESPLAGFLHWLLYLFREPFYDYTKSK